MYVPENESKKSKKETASQQMCEVGQCSGQSFSTPQCLGVMCRDSESCEITHVIKMADLHYRIT